MVISNYHYLFIFLFITTVFGNKDSLNRQWPQISSTSVSSPKLPQSISVSADTVPNANASEYNKEIHENNISTVANKVHPDDLHNSGKILKKEHMEDTKSSNNYPHDLKLQNQTSLSRYKSRVLKKHLARHGSKRKRKDNHSRTLLNNTIFYMNMNDSRLNQVGTANWSVESGDIGPGPTLEIDQIEDFQRFEMEFNETRFQSGSRRPYFTFKKDKLPIAYSHSAENINGGDFIDNEDRLGSVQNSIFYGHLRCYTCNESHGESCYNLPTDNGTVDLTGQKGVSSQLCSDEEPYCMVSRVWFITKLPLNNKTQHHFSIRRGCQRTCDPYCIMMGDRREVEIFACKTCCTTSDCNIGSGSAELGTSALLSLSLSVIIAVTTK